MKNFMKVIKVLGSIVKWTAAVIVAVFGLLAVVVCLCVAFDEDEEDDYYTYNYDDMECIPPKEERVPNHESESEEK